MNCISPLHSFFRSLTGRSRPVGPVHPDAVSEASLRLPRRVDDPSTAAPLPHDLLRNRREDITLALYLDDQHRLVGHAVVAVDKVQAARLSARPLLFGARVCRATGCILVRYRRFGLLGASDAETRSFRALADAVARHGLVLVDHLVVIAGGGYSSKRVPPAT